VNGKKLTQEFLDFIDTKEVSDNYASQRRIFDCLDMSAGIYCRDTRSLHNAVSITTVAAQQNYNLPPDFIDLYLQDANGRFFIRYYDGGNTSWPTLISYDRLYRLNLTDSQDSPSHFALVDSPTQPPLITGTATAAGVKTSGRCILTDSTKHFLTTDLVYPRDIIYNANDDSLGIVLAVIDDTHLYVALFEGAADDWTNADAYTIQPAAQKTLVLQTPSLTAGHIIHVSYVCMPAPVYWDFAAWNFPERTCRAIASGAASIFKIGKTEYKESQSLGGLFDAEIKQYKTELGRQKLQQGPSSRRERM
jgi:hypothetical protein